ncbi:hypothetical protein BGW39_000352 [Mortierella sp. 14UC]|nr:hypothetical protein BGW39_000352 [Mortierella sp. 14UC]
MSANDKPIVLIVGGGLGGLMLGALFEKSNVPYTIFERSAIVKPLGSAMAVGPTLLAIFQQMGIYDEFLTIGKYMTDSFGYSESLKAMSPHDHRPFEEYSGYAQYIVSRPKLYELMLKQVPAHKILFGHRVLNISEENNKVKVHLSNNETFEGDIIVGADGAYSAVRQRMYEQLMAKGELPKSDQEELPFSCTCLVGQTKVLDPKDFPIVATPHCHFTTVLGDDKPYTSALEQRFRDTNNSEWGAHPAQAMCEETRNFPIPPAFGQNLTMGDLYDQTPKEFISKVMLEEKVFKTWHHRRYVLMGDACHKLHPAGGHGAVTAMHDAIALANLIYAMPCKTQDDITTIFAEYHKERLPAVMDSYKKSQIMSKIFDRGIVGTLVVYMVTQMPAWLWKIALGKLVQFRPQLGFLEPVKLMGTVVPVISPSEQKARAVFEKQQQQQQNAAAV